MDLKEKNVILVNYYYQQGLWSIEMVRNSVNKWIDEKTYELITGEKYA